MSRHLRQGQPPIQGRVIRHAPNLRPGTRLRYGATPLGPEGSMVPRAETSLPKTDTKPTPFVRVRGKALGFRSLGAPLKPREGENGSFPSKVGEFSLQYSITLY